MEKWNVEKTVNFLPKIQEFSYGFSDNKLHKAIFYGLVAYCPETAKYYNNTVLDTYYPSIDLTAFIKDLCTDEAAEVFIRFINKFK